MTENTKDTKDTQKTATDETPQGLDRRSFLVGTATAVAATSGILATATAHADGTTAQGKSNPATSSPVEFVDEKSGKSRIVQVTHTGATEKVKKTNEEVVRKMVAKALTEFTGESTPAKALGKYFKKTDVVGIKVNCLGSPYATVHPSTAFALADALHELGIEKKNIYIYDQYGSRMRKAGFKILANEKQYKEDTYPVHSHGTLGYAKERVATGGFLKHKKKGEYPPGTSQFPKLLDRLTAVLNVCCVKDHDLTGVTGALKNVSYGNVERVPIYHCMPACNPTCAHDGLCNVSRIYKHEKMGGLVRLVVCDALRVLYQGGPQDNMTYKKAHNAIMVSTDPVAIDRACLEIVNGYRKERKLKILEEDQGGRRNPMRHLAAANKLGLGEHDIAKITWDKVNMG